MAASSEDNDAFGAFDSSLSEYASAESALAAEAADATSSSSSSSSNNENDDDDLFDAFVDATNEDDAAGAGEEEDDDAVLAEPRAAGEGGAGEVRKDEEEDIITAAATAKPAASAWSEVDLFGTSGEAVSDSTQEGGDPFGAFDSIGPEQVVDAASNGGNDALDDFGAFGSATGTTGYDDSPEDEKITSNLGSATENDDNAFSHQNNISSGDTVKAPADIMGNQTKEDGNRLPTAEEGGASSSSNDGHESDDPSMSAFDAFGSAVGDAPLPSLDGIASNSNNVNGEEDKLGAAEGKDEGNTTASMGGTGEVTLNGHAGKDAQPRENGKEIEEVDKEEDEERGSSSNDDIAETLPVQMDENNAPVEMGNDIHDGGFGGFASPQAESGDAFGAFNSDDNMPRLREPILADGNNEQDAIIAVDEREDKKDFEPSDGNGAANSMESKKIENTTSDIMIVEDDANGFGGFVSLEGASPEEDAPEEQLEAAMPSSDNDDFGGVTSFGDATPIATEPQNEPASPAATEGAMEQVDAPTGPVITDDFGGFTAFGDAAPPAAEPQNEATGQEGDFGGFSSFGEEPAKMPVEEPGSQPLAGSIASASENGSKDDNVGGATDALESNFEGAASEVITDGNGDFGGFPYNEGSSPGEDAPEQRDDTALPNTTDDFGGFTAFEESTPQATEPGNEASAQGNDFGGFEEIPANPFKEPISQEPVLDEVNTASVIENGEKHDVMSEPSDAIDGANALENNFEGIDNEMGINDRNDFGGFASIEGTLVGGVVPEQQDASSEAPSSNHDFGGFTASEESTPPAVGLENEATVQDDDFRGFSSFEEGPANPPGENLAGQASALDEENVTPVSKNGEMNNFLPKSHENNGTADVLDCKSEGAGSEMKAADSNASIHDAATAMPNGDDKFGSIEADIHANTEAIEDLAAQDGTESKGDVENVAGFASFEEDRLNELAAVTSLAADAAFGTFGAFSEEPDTDAADASTRNDQTEPIPAGEENADIQSSKVVVNSAGADDEFGDSSDFNAVEETVADTSPKDGVRAESNLHSSSPADEDFPLSTADDSFGDFGDFNTFEDPQVTSPDDASTKHDQHLPTATEEEATPSQPLAVVSSADDDEFGDFGDFDAFEEAPEAPESSSAKTDEATSSAKEEPPAIQPSAAVTSEDADDEFGAFGDFDEFEEAPSEASTSEPTPSAASDDLLSNEKASASQVTQAEEEASAADDEFGDFGDFEEFEEAPKNPSTEGRQRKNDQSTSAPAAEIAPKPALSILNDNVRLMFKDVFVCDAAIHSDLQGKGTRSELAFDIPMCKILPEKLMLKEEEKADSQQSELELAKMRKFFETLPRTPSVTILSDEKWYPYSQYEFHRDGSPYANSVERVSQPSVPEVLSIYLPTGFEASNLSKPASNAKQSNITSSSIPPAAYQSTPTVVDFPSTSKKERNTISDSQKRKKESDVMDVSQLSITGKKFMEQLPDLSYMLKSTLSLPNDTNR